MTHQIELRVKPNSRKFYLEVYDNSIDVYVKNQARKGKANKEIIEEFSSLLGLHSNNVRIVRGFKNSIKIVEITNIKGSRLKELLSKANQLE